MMEFQFPSWAKMKKIVTNNPPVPKKEGNVNVKPIQQPTPPRPRPVLFSAAQAQKPVKLMTAENATKMANPRKPDNLIHDTKLETTSTKPELPQPPTEEDVKPTSLDKSDRDNANVVDRPSTVAAARTWKRLIGLPYDPDTEEADDKYKVTAVSAAPGADVPLVREKIQPTALIQGPTPPPPQALVREKIPEIIRPGSGAVDFSIPLPVRGKKQNPSVNPQSTSTTTSQKKPVVSQQTTSPIQKRDLETTPAQPEVGRGVNQTVNQIQDKTPSPQSSPQSPAPTRPSTPNSADAIDPGRPTTSSRNKTTPKLNSTPKTTPSPVTPRQNSVRNSRTSPASRGQAPAKNKHHTHKLSSSKGENVPTPPLTPTPIPKKKMVVKFIAPNLALAKERKEVDMVAGLDKCSSYEEAPIWLCFRLWDYQDNISQLKKFIKLDVGAEGRGDEIADMRKIFDFHGMNTCLDCFMLDEECNMRNVGYIIDDDVLISFNNILPYMTQYFVDLRDTFYGKNPAQNALIRQWINYCVRNIRGRRVSEYMWDEMNDHLGIDGFFGGSYRTMADTLMYVSLYNRIRRWEPQDFAKRYNISHWFRLMQKDDRLRGGNQLLEINPSSDLHPNYPFDAMKRDILNLKEANKLPMIVRNLVKHKVVRPTNAKKL